MNRSQLWQYNMSFVCSVCALKDAAKYSVQVLFTSKLKYCSNQVVRETVLFNKIISMVCVACQVTTQIFSILYCIIESVDSISRNAPD